jgi:hypothetical protein
MLWYEEPGFVSAGFYGMTTPAKGGYLRKGRADLIGLLERSMRHQPHVMVLRSRELRSITGRDGMLGHTKREAEQARRLDGVGVGTTLRITSAHPSSCARSIH